jgi:tetratricopeptide (TPR) repeat protein
MLLPLGALGQKAAATMVRTVLPDAPDDRVAQLIERAGGSALFLEELVRADAEGRGGETPGSVLAMMQSKLEALPADQRRVLRAASVFGRAFWRGAIADLVHAPDFTLDVLLAALVERDLLVRVTGARFPMEREYVFRHDLVREGAYALLTEEDRVAAHRHAGRWLARAGESDAAVLAEHYDKGADGQRAIASYVIAARHALEHNELGAADALAARAMRCGANGHARGELLAVQAEVAWWTADLVSATDLGEAALRELEPGVVWSVTACVVARAAASLGDATRADAVARAILRAPMPDARVAVGIYRAATSLLLAGRDALAGELAAGVPVFDDAGVRAARFSYLANVHGARGETGAALESNMAALAAANEAGDARLACVVSCNLGLGLGEVGDDVAAQQLVIQVVHEAQRLGLQRVLAGAKANLGVIRARQGATAEGVALIRESIESGRELADARLEGASHAYLAELLLQQRDHTLARGEAIEAAQLLAGVPLASFAFAVLCRIELARGDVTAARAAASRIELTRIEENEAYIRLAWAEALRAGGDLAGASASIHGARDRLLTRAATMAPHHRTSFLENVAENARTLVLAREWGV